MLRQLLEDPIVMCLVGAGKHVRLDQACDVSATPSSVETRSSRRNIAVNLLETREGVGCVLDWVEGGAAESGSTGLHHRVRHCKPCCAQLKLEILCAWGMLGVCAFELGVFLEKNNDCMRGVGRAYFGIGFVISAWF